MGKNYKLVVGVNEAGEIVEAEQHPLGYSALELFEIPPKRFDPFEALDVIEETIRFCPERIRNKLDALRAYITGREQ